MRAKLLCPLLGVLLLAISNAAQANVDPRYNISCTPGTLVMYLPASKGAPGIYFECKADFITRSIQLRQLKEDAAVEEWPTAALSAEILWWLNLYFDEANRVTRYQNKFIAAREEAERSRD